MKNLHEKIQALLGRTLGEQVVICDVDDIDVSGDIAILPLTAIPSYDDENLANCYGIFCSEELNAMIIDLSREDARSNLVKLASGYLQKLSDTLLKEGFSAVVFLCEDDYNSFSMPFTGETFTPAENAQNSNIGHMMCPHCAHRDSFDIDVTGADPDNVDIMESQSRIQRRLAEGDLNITTFTARFFHDGSEDTASDVSWEDDSPVTCASCGHQGTMATFESLHYPAED